MARSPPPAKRAEVGLTSTFDVLVGKDGLMPSPQRFTPYTNVFIPRSELFRAARSSQWQSDPQKPVDLTDEDPETFSFHINCDYFGVEVFQDSPLEEALRGQGEETGSVDDDQIPDIFACSEEDIKALSRESDQEDTDLDVQLDDHHAILIRLYLMADKLKN